MLTQSYACPKCKARLVRVARWLGYACERCALAVTFINRDEARLTTMSGEEATTIPVSALIA